MLPVDWQTNKQISFFFFFQIAILKDTTHCILKRQIKRSGLTRHLRSPCSWASWSEQRSQTGREAPTGAAEHRLLSLPIARFYPKRVGPLLEWRCPLFSESEIKYSFLKENLRLLVSLQRLRERSLLGPGCFSSGPKRPVSVCLSVCCFLHLVNVCHAEVTQKQFLDQAP